MKEKGYSKDIRRQALPIGIETVLVATHNLRSWHHILEVRTEEHAHAEIREAAAKILFHLRYFFPVVFEDFEPVDREHHIYSTTGDYPPA